MKASITPPGVTLPAAATPPRLPLDIAHTPDVCNNYIPMDSVRTRFFWVMKFLASNGFYVVIDDHLSYDSTIVDNTPAWVAGWKSLAMDVAADPVLRNRVLFDIANEPASRGINWATGPNGVGMATYYEQAMDAIHSAHPTALLLIEGCEQGNVSMNWGDGFATDDALVSPAESAKPFFQKVGLLFSLRMRSGAFSHPKPSTHASPPPSSPLQMMTKPYLHNIVIAPHIYPPSVSTRHDPATVFAPGLFSRLDNS